MFVLDNSEQGDRSEFRNAYAASLALLTELQRQWRNDTSDDTDAGSEWLALVSRAKGLVRRAEDGAYRINVPIRFDLPTGESLILSEREEGK